MKLLKQLYWINSPSHSEQGMSGFIRSILHSQGIKFETDEFYQIFSLKNPDKPILCAHIDQVGDEPITTLIETKDTITGDLNIGADDKNGIWIILKLLEKDPDLNFIFSTADLSSEDLSELVIPSLADSRLLKVPATLCAA